MSGLAPHRYLVSCKPLGLENLLLLLLPLVCLPINHKSISRPSITMMRVGVQLNVCCRKGTDQCAENVFAASTTDNEANIMDVVFDAGIDAGISVHQYQEGQEGLIASPGDPKRRQATTRENQSRTEPDNQFGTPENQTGTTPENQTGAAPGSSSAGSVNSGSSGSDAGSAHSEAGDLSGNSNAGGLSGNSGGGLSGNPGAGGTG